MLQADGNLLVGNATGVKWTTATDGLAGAILKLQDDGNVVLYYAGRAVWSQGSGFTGDLLSSQQGLQAGQQVRSRNGRYRLTMQGDGNLVLYRDGPHAVWSSGTGGTGRSQAIMQADGNLVVGNSAGPTWSSATSAFDQAALVVQDDGNVVIYHNGHAIWTGGSGFIGDTLSSGATLNPGAYLKSPNRAFTLIMQPGDGNLVLYGPSAALWSFETGGHPGARAVMQTDGNFVVYASSGGAVASTRTGTAGSIIRVQDDNNLVIYNGGAPVWSRFAGILGGFRPQLPFPVGQAWQANGAHGFGGSSGVRNSVDFGTTNGSAGTVVASAAGRVASVTNCGGGYEVRINHDDGWQTGYYHLSSAAVSAGASVTRGQAIGATGTGCGAATFRHVHFSLRRNGADIDLNGLAIGGHVLESKGYHYGGRWLLNGSLVVQDVNGEARCCLTSREP